MHPLSGPRMLASHAASPLASPSPACSASEQLQQHMQHKQVLAELDGTDSFPGVKAGEYDEPGSTSRLIDPNLYNHLLHTISGYNGDLVKSLSLLKEYDTHADQNLICTVLSGVSKRNHSRMSQDDSELFEQLLVYVSRIVALLDLLEEDQYLRIVQMDISDLRIMATTFRAMENSDPGLGVRMGMFLEVVAKATSDAVFEAMEHQDNPSFFSDALSTLLLCSRSYVIVTPKASTRMFVALHKAVIVDKTLRLDDLTDESIVELLFAASKC
eukprot:gene15310-21396_t